MDFETPPIYFKFDPNDSIAISFNSSDKDPIRYICESRGILKERIGIWIKKSQSESIKGVIVGLKDFKLSLESILIDGWANNSVDLFLHYLTTDDIDRYNTDEYCWTIFASQKISDKSK